MPVFRFSNVSLIGKECCSNSSPSLGVVCRLRRLVSKSPDLQFLLFIKKLPFNMATVSFLYQKIQPFNSFEGKPVEDVAMWL